MPRPRAALWLMSWLRYHAPAANRAPSFTSVTVTPPFGVQDFGLFTFNAAATDPDGDALVYTWSIGSNMRAGQTVQSGPFTTGGTFTASVTVEDGRGGVQTSSLTFIVGTMTGSWRGSVFNSNALPTFSMSLTQVLGFFAGEIMTPVGSGQVGPSGALATINASGQVTMRIKVAPFTDFTMTGQMDTTGRRVTGSVSGSGFTGQPFILERTQ